MKTAINNRVLRRVRPTLGAYAVVSASALAGCSGNFCLGTDGCGWTDGTQQVALSGTAATGTVSLAGASVVATCAQGSASTVSDNSAHYSLNFRAALPCVLTVTSGSTVLHSTAFAGGTFNVTPETELMLVYLAAQLGTTESNLIAGVADNAWYQQVLENPNDVLAAQTAVVANLQQRYAVTIGSPAFLTTPFVVGQSGVDSDLVTLANAGAIDPNGQPDSVAVSLLSAAGRARPIAQ